MTDISAIGPKEHIYRSKPPNGVPNCTQQHSHPCMACLCVYQTYHEELKSVGFTTGIGFLRWLWCWLGLPNSCCRWWVCDNQRWRCEWHIRMHAHINILYVADVGLCSAPTVADGESATTRDGEVNGTHMYSATEQESKFSFWGATTKMLIPWDSYELHILEFSI